MKTFILLSAVPGSGKSTWAEEYRLTHDNVFIVSSDSLRKELTGKIQNFDMEEEVWNRFREDILKYLDYKDDVTVIADATNITNGHRKFYAEFAKDFDKKVLVIFNKSFEDISKGNDSRAKDRIVPNDIVKSMFEKFEDVNEENKKLYDEIIYVDKHFNAPHVKHDFHYN